VTKKIVDSPRALQFKKIVGLAGFIGSGKSTVAEFLIKKGFQHLRFSDPIETEIKKRKLPLKRAVYQDIGDEWREKFGLDYISKLLLAEAEKSTETHFVVDGFRNPGELPPFKSYPGFLLVGIYADQQLRFERLRKRGLPRDPKTWGQFQEQEDRDLGIGQPEFGQNNLAVFEAADILVINRGKLAEVLAEVELVLQKKGII